MNAVTFDTLKFAERLQESGFTPEQSKALAEAQAEINEASLEELVTRGDLQKEVGQLKIWVLSVLLGQTGILLAGMFAMIQLLKG